MDGGCATWPDIRRISRGALAVNTSSWSPTSIWSSSRRLPRRWQKIDARHRRTLFELVEDLVIAPVAATAAGESGLMQLLVSVANPAEARHALDGGADLIDAKDPSSGALGAVSLDTLRQIHTVVAGRRVVTAALGDAIDEESIERAAFDYGRIGVGFVKVGFAGIAALAR